MPVSWRFQIWKVTDDRLPAVNTCMTAEAGAGNQGDPMPTLYLPDYETKAVFVEKLRLAMTTKSLNKV